MYINWHFFIELDVTYIKYYTWGAAWLFWNLVHKGEKLIETREIRRKKITFQSILRCNYGKVEILHIYRTSKWKVYTPASSAMLFCLSSAAPLLRHPACMSAWQGVNVRMFLITGTPINLGHVSSQLKLKWKETLFFTYISTVWYDFHP